MQHLVFQRNRAKAEAADLERELLLSARKRTSVKRSEAAFLRFSRKASENGHVLGAAPFGEQGLRLKLIAPVSGTL